MIDSGQLLDATRLDLFGDQTVSLVCRALRAEWGSFYRIGANLRPFGFRTIGVPREFGMAYRRNVMENVDPLHPFRLVPHSPKRRFLTMVDARAASPTRYTEFRSFLSSFGGQEAGEMIFYCAGRAVAGLSLIWVGHKPEYRATTDLGASLHSYAEFNLDTLWRTSGPSPHDAMETLAARHALTEREIEVAQAVCHGLTNHDIARKLNIALATVKTHLIHIFTKAGVESRSELVSRLLTGRH